MSQLYLAFTLQLYNSRSPDEPTDKGLKIVSQEALKSRIKLSNKKTHQKLKTTRNETKKNKIFMVRVEEQSWEFAYSIGRVFLVLS